MTGGLQFTCVLIDPKGENISTGLVGRNQEFTSGIDAEVTRRFTQGGLVLHGTQLPCLLIDTENRNCVMPAVGAVKELPARMHLYFRRTHPFPTLDR